MPLSERTEGRSWALARRALSRAQENRHGQHGQALKFR